MEARRIRQPGVAAEERVVIAPGVSTPRAAAEEGVEVAIHVGKAGISAEEGVGLPRVDGARAYPRDEIVHTRVAQDASAANVVLRRGVDRPERRQRRPGPGVGYREREIRAYGR